MTCDRYVFILFSFTTSKLLKFALYSKYTYNSKRSLNDENIFFSNSKLNIMFIFRAFQIYTTFYKIYTLLFDLLRQKLRSYIQ